MADEPRHASQIREWVQTVIIVMGVVLGIWQFWFKEILIPAGAPINITTEVTVKKAGFRGVSSGVGNEQFEAMELVVVAKNPSTRDVWMLSNCWYAQGIAVVTRKQEKDWTNAIAKQIENNEPSNEGAYYKWDKTLGGHDCRDGIVHSVQEPEALQPARTRAWQAGAGPGRSAEPGCPYRFPSAGGQN